MAVLVHFAQITTFFAAFLLTTACTVEAQQQNTTPYSEATYSIPADPAKVILHITAAGGMRKKDVSSATLYSDGRLEITNQRKGEYLRSLNDEELRQVLQIAVGHGLAEWHSSTIRAKQIKKLEGRPFPIPSDAMRATVLLALDDYRRGDYKFGSVEKTIRVKGPEVARKYFPEIPQYEGITQLIFWLQGQVNKSEKESK